DPHDPGAVAVVAGGQVQAAGVERPAVAADDVDAAGPGIQRIGEVAPALNAEDAVFGGEVVADGAGQVLGQVDAVVDVDLVGIDGDVEAVRRLQHQAEAEVGGLLRLQPLGAERDRGRVGHPEGDDVIWHAFNDVGGGGVELLLLQRRRAEAGRGGGAQ